MSPFSCLRKKRYASKKEAESAIFSIRARNQDADRLTVERCSLCHCWHLKRREPGMVTPAPPIQLPIETTDNVEGSP